MSNVEFNEGGEGESLAPLERLNRVASEENQSSFVKALVKAGIAKDEKGANVILLGLSFCCIIATIIIVVMNV